MTLFAISQAIRKAGATIWHIDFDQPFGVVFRAEFGHRHFRLVKMKHGFKPEDVAEEKTLTHVASDAEALTYFLSQVTQKTPVIGEDYGRLKTQL